MRETEPLPLVRLRGVTKTFKRGPQRVEVLKELDLDVARGDFLALMGPSGSGKTTLLNILGGIDSATSGEVIVDGNPLQKMGDGALTRWRARHVGFVFQFYHLLPVLTAEENVALPLLLTNLSAGERKRRARAALALVGLADRAGHKPGELSGGQEQRVGIARAIVTRPDDAFCATNRRATSTGRRAMRILHLLHLLNTEHGKTIIIVTHDPRAAARAHHTLFMDKGVLSEEPESVQ